MGGAGRPARRRAPGASTWSPTRLPATWQSRRLCARVCIVVRPRRALHDNLARTIRSGGGGGGGWGCWGDAMPSILTRFKQRLIERGGRSVAHSDRSLPLKSLLLDPLDALGGDPFDRPVHVRTRHQRAGDRRRVASAGYFAERAGRSRISLPYSERYLDIGVPTVHPLE